ncbi:polysaccharide deacetylase family protein [uncultured Eubacterium sp.]|uniref:polysaccharide deacetylase family protein n=1 Tax=uncultured Eubacterium sp. TaxID=165185 RepID=UPI002672EFE1|nr:polysaccharide deacetylase family protein [uncultured Eubacterium sp.]
MANPEQTSLLKRSILWLCVLLAVVGLTYYYEENLFKNGWQALTASTSTKELPIYNVQTDKKQVALSFDAAWGNEDTQKILDTLKKYKINVTFFMTGGWVEKYPDDVKAINEAGHDLGNHSENHKHMPQLSTTEMADELNKVTEKVKALTGVTMHLFRPPYGDYDNNLIIQAKSCGYYTIQWNVDSLDWKNYGVDAIVNTVLNHKDLKNGSIILMHNGAKYTAEALPKVIEGLQEKGYTIVPISKLIYKDNYHMEHDGSQVSDKQAESVSNRQNDNKSPSKKKD